jgi:hypothetical protein
LSEIVILALAVLSLHTAWYEGSMFAVWREHVEAWRGLSGYKKPLAFVGELLGCKLCMSIWLAILLAVLFKLTPAVFGGWWVRICDALLAALAAAALIQVYHHWLDE